ncbi:MAG: 4Fe-4S binding protein, partial [Methanosarcinaceae archaeon]|nr:4Fe-4S binding protein [Methanosarcinaceae archaeon]
MANLFNLVRAFGRISSHSLTSVSHERCLNRRYDRVLCNRCEHVCRADAISLDTVPSIDGTACTGCGVCVNVCPTGAFALRDISKENIISSIEEG